jgi:thioredoxin 1
VENLVADGFEDAVGEGLVLVDFWAEWCGPCHAQSPVLEELASSQTVARIAKLDVEKHPSVGERFGVTGLPTLILFRDGIPIKRLHGVKNRRQLERAIQEA